MRPIDHPLDISRFARVPVDVVDVPAEVVFITDAVFPKTTLPKSEFVALVSRRRWAARREMFATQLAGVLLDHGPTCGEISINRRQCPEAMQVIGQQYPGIDSERPGYPGALDRLAQCDTEGFLCEKRLTTMRADREEIRCTGIFRATVIRHSVASIWKRSVRGAHPTIFNLRDRCTRPDLPGIP